MKNIFLKKTDGAALDATLVSDVQRMYMPPAVARGDQSYWSSLEQRIMARVADPGFLASIESPRWWNVLEGWSRAGLVAAGIAVAVSAALIQNQAVDENSEVYEYVSAAAAPETLTSVADQNDSVLNYVLAR